MEFTDFTQLTDWFSQAATWFCGVLIVLLSGVSLLGCLFCLGGTIVQACLELRHQRRYQRLASPLALHSIPEAKVPTAAVTQTASLPIQRFAQF